MTERDPLLDVLRRFARTMSKHYEITDTLYDFCDHVVEVMAAEGAGVSLLDDDGELRFVTATSEQVVAAERAQERMKDGPCYQSVRECRPVVVRDIRDHAEQWPEFCETVAEHRLGAIVGIPLALDEERIGSLNIYDRGPREWTDEEVDRAGVLADIASAYVLNASELARSRRTQEQLQHALDARVVIEQAKGKLAGQRGLGMDDAFEVIRRHARSNNRTVRSVAEDIIGEGVDFLGR